MAFKIGSTDFTKAYLGSTEIDNIQLGQTEVYSSFPVGNDLKLRLEATDYSGSGNTWTDSAQSLTFTSSGTQTPYTTIGGASCFDFNGSGYWSSAAGASGSNLVDMRGTFTLIIIYYSQGISERDSIFEKAGTSYQSYEQELALTMEPSNRNTYYRGKSNYSYGYTKTLTNNRWNLMAIKSEGTTVRTGHYWSGSAWVSDYVNRGNNAITQAGAIRIGTGYAGPMESGYLGSVLVYDRALTVAEMSSLFTHYSGIYNNLL